MSTAVATKPKLRIVKLEPMAPAAKKRKLKPSRVDTYSTHPAMGLTVEMLLSYYREAERGSPVRQFDCWEDQLERDGHAWSHFDGRIQSVAGCEMVIKPGREDKPSELAAGALADRLADVNFREFVEHQLEAPHYGIAATNIIWDFVERVIAPIDFVNGAHRRFASPSPERASEIMLIEGNSPRDLAELDAGCWALSRYRGRNPWMSGSLRKVAWWSMVKGWSVRDWQVFAEMFGIPMVVGFYESGAGEQTRLTLEEAVRQVGTDLFAVLEDTCELIIKEARTGDSSTVFPHIIAIAEAQVSKVLSGATLTSDAGGPGSKGSYALGAVHESRGYALARADARRIEDMFKRDVALPFKLWNGFDRAATPHLSVKITRDSLDRAKVLQIVGQLIDLDEDQLRDEFSLKKPPAGKGVRFVVKKADPKTDKEDA